MKRIAVTGGSGEIGSHIIRHLQEQGYAVTNFDRIKCPVPGIHTVLLDTASFGDVVSCFQGYEGIVHLAAISCPGRESANRMYSVNVQSTFNMLEAAAVLRINKVVLASSLNALGLAFNLEQTIRYVPLDEAHPCHPDEAYSLSKLVGETTADGFARRFPDMTIASLRFPGIFTPRMYNVHRPSVGYQRKALWSYADVRDIARAVQLSLEATWRGHEVFMLAAEDTLSERPSRELMAEHYPQAEIRSELNGNASLVSCEKAARLLGWKHERRFADCLREFAAQAPKA